MKTGIHIILFVMASIALVSSALGDPQWPEYKHSEVRVLHSHILSDADNGSYLVGLHVKMRKGWKTYWRKPGESGIPPHMDWANSSNLKSAKIYWPAPARMIDPYGYSIGYVDEVVFPVLLKAKQPGQPVNASLLMTFGICKEVCIPVQEKVNFSVPSSTSTKVNDHRLLSEYYNRTPKDMPVGPISSDKSPKLPVIVKVSSRIRSARPQISLKIMYPGKSDYNDMFVEVSDGFYMADPKISKREQGKGKHEIITYNIDLTKGDSVNELKGKTITVTMVSKGSSSRSSWQVK